MMHKKFFSLFSVLLLIFVHFFSAKSAYQVCAETNHNEEFVQTFKGSIDKYIGYKEGNNKTISIHGFNYFVSSFLYNKEIDSFIFGRSSNATLNIKDKDELSMLFDLSGHIDSINIDIGTVNSNIIFATSYSIDYGKSWILIEQSYQEIKSNEAYNLFLDSDFNHVRFKFEISNVNETAGKNMVINSLNILGQNIYSFDLNDIIVLVDHCNCENYLTYYAKIDDAYNKLSDFEKQILSNSITDDRESTYFERLNYFWNYCRFASSNVENKEEEITDTITSPLTSQNRNMDFIYIILSCLFITIIGVVFGLIKKHRNNNVDK